MHPWVMMLYAESAITACSKHTDRIVTDSSQSLFVPAMRANHSDHVTGTLPQPSSGPLGGQEEDKTGICM